MQSDNERSALLGSVSQNTRQERDDEPKGAKPKIRKTKEAKRRRFVMKKKQVKSKPQQQLESVSETEEEGTQQLLLRPSETAARGQEFFGVRSYVHTFYEAMAMEETYGDRLKGVRSRRWNCWRATFFAGLLILATGLAALLAGNLVRKRREVVDVQEDIEIINRADQAFNRNLDVCKIVGIVLFCSGGALVTIVLLAMTFARRQRMEEDIYLTELETGSDPAPPVRVPATEEVRAVQPKRTDPGVVPRNVCEVP